MGTLTLVLSIIGLISGIIGIGSWIWKGGGMAKELSVLVEHHKKCPIADIQVKLAKIEQQNELFWSVIQPHLAEIIHSPDHKRRDELVDKLVSNQITDHELIELKSHLCQEATNGVKEKRLPSALLLARVEMLLRESKILSREG